jgi:RNA polymerase sigma factor (sigma-70 family)
MPPSRREWEIYDPENFLAKERRDLGLSIAEMLRRIGDGGGRNTYRAVETGAASPLYRDGKIRPHIAKACEILGVGFEDVFPREVCRLPGYGVDLTPDQLMGIAMREEDYDAEFVCCFKRGLAHALKGLTATEAVVVILREIEGLTYEEIGARFGVTMERARQIAAKGLRKMRHPCRATHLKELWED